MEYSTQALIDSRMKLAELRNALRILKHTVEKTRLKVEAEAITKADGNYGKNAEERERYLKLAINESIEYVNMEDEILSLQIALELEEAKIESLRDLRREAEMNLKERMIDSNVNFE
jgi:hypothetical protein